MGVGNALNRTRHEGPGLAIDSYVVRIYRRSSESSREAAGLIERAGDGRRMAFSSSQELWALCDKPDSAIPKQSRKRCKRREP
jgi:hypothetical protein